MENKNKGELSSIEIIEKPKLSREQVEEILKNSKNLSGFDLSGLDLSGLDFTDANLQDADLTNANLTCANLTRACLINARLIKVKSTKTIFKNANLTSAYLEEICLCDVIDFIDVDLTNATLKEVKFESIDLSNELINTNLTNTKLINTDLAYTVLKDVKLEEGKDINGSINSIFISENEIKKIYNLKEGETFLGKTKGDFSGFIVPNHMKKQYIKNHINELYEKEAKIKDIEKRIVQSMNLQIQKLEKINLEINDVAKIVSCSKFEDALEEMDNLLTSNSYALINNF